MSSAGAWSQAAPDPAPPQASERVAPASPEEPPAAPDPVPDEKPSLAQTQQRLIEDTLQANGGNVARTARQLGVSRGLVYRHLRR